MSVAQQVLDDLSQALEVDRVKAFEAGRLAEREAAFDVIQDSYRRGVADAEARIIKLLEDSHEENTWQHYPTKWVYMEDCAVCSVLPLIKGEK